MHQKFLLFSSILLLGFIISSTYAKEEGHVSTTTETTTTSTSTKKHHTTSTGTTTTSTKKHHTTSTGTTTTSTKKHHTTTTETTTTSTKKHHTTSPNKPHHSKPPKGKKPNHRGGSDGYYNDYYQTGVDGIDPSEYGQDLGDFGPIYDKEPAMLQSLDVWIAAVDEWETEGEKYYRKGSGNYNKKYNKGKKYDNKKYDNKKYDNKNYDNKKYDNDNYNDGSRQKRSYSRVRFPVKQVKNFRRLPFGRFPPLISIFPWLPIFYDKLTYQTFIFSPTGGIYIIPPLINFYGQRFAVAQLIKWGYASLVSSGAPPPPSVDVAPLVQPPPPAGGAVTAGVVGSTAVAPAPTYDSKKYRFNGGVKTDFPTFKPRYSQTLEEGEDRNYGPNYKAESNYGGTRNQELSAQGGQRSGGNGYNY